MSLTTKLRPLTAVAAGAAITLLASCSSSNDNPPVTDPFNPGEEISDDALSELDISDDRLDELFRQALEEDALYPGFCDDVEFVGEDALLAMMQERFKQDIPIDWRSSWTVILFEFIDENCG